MSFPFRFSEAHAIALHAIICINNAAPKQISVKELAKIIKCSKDHLSKVLQLLAKADLVVSTRGPKGGFSLNKPAEKITLKDVIEGIDGKVKWISCLFLKPVCKGGDCIFAEFIREVNQKLKNFLEKTTIAEIKDKVPLCNEIKIDEK